MRYGINMKGRNLTESKIYSVKPKPAAPLRSTTHFLFGNRRQDSDSDSDKFIQQKYIQVPYQVYMSFLEIQITL